MLFEVTFGFVVSARLLVVAVSTLDAGTVSILLLLLFWRAAASSVFIMVVKAIGVAMSIIGDSYCSYYCFGLVAVRVVECCFARLCSFADAVVL